MGWRAFVEPSMPKMLVFFVLGVLLEIFVFGQYVRVFDSTYYGSNTVFTGANGTFFLWAWLLLKFLKVAGVLVLAYLLACLVASVFRLEKCGACEAENGTIQEKIIPTRRKKK